MLTVIGKVDKAVTELLQHLQLGPFEYLLAPGAFFFVSDFLTALPFSFLHFFLHLAERVEPGTRAFVAAYLGEEEVRATPEVPGLVGRGS